MYSTIANKVATLLFSWKVFIFCNVLIFILKFIFSAKLGFQADHYEDWAIAENLAKSGKYAMDLTYGSTAYKLPVYPCFLSLYMKVFGISESVPWIIVTQHLFYFIIPFFLIRIFLQFGFREAGFMAAYFFIFSPSYFFYSNVIEATNIFLPLSVMWIYGYAQIWEKGASKGIIIYSILTAIIALTQVVAVPIMALLIMVLLFRRKVSLMKIMVMGCLSVIFYAPWVVRNKVVFDKLILSKSPVWQNIYLGYLPDYQILGYRFISEEDGKKTLALTSQLNEFQDETVYHKEVEKIISKEHWAPIKKALNNLFSLWYIPKKYFDDGSLTVLVGRKLYVVILNIAFGISMISIFLRNKKLFYVLSLVFAGFTFPYLIGHAANIRFKLDFEWIQTSVIALFLAFTFFKGNLNKIS